MYSAPIINIPPPELHSAEICRSKLTYPNVSKLLKPLVLIKYGFLLIIYISLINTWLQHTQEGSWRTISPFDIYRRMWVTLDRRNSFYF